MDLFTTSVGSHMWGMNHPGSDLDIFIAYISPTTDILMGVEKTDSRHEHGEVEDKAFHEIGKVVDMVIAGNVNFLWGVLSPIVVSDPHDILKELRPLTMMNLSKKCYGSIHGLAVSNVKKYIETGKDTSPKRCNIIGRTILFGIGLLTSGIPAFHPVKDMSLQFIQDLMKQLDDARDKSTLPDAPSQNAQSEIRHWLIRTRLTIGSQERGVFS